MADSPITPTIPLDAPGKQHGFLRLPWSRDDSAWGSLQVPICVVGGSTGGPTALLTGGNHGDEYEGPLALLDLARTLEPDAVSGRVIIVPFMNLPAVQAGKRTSPVDGGNMNRAFPGNPAGTLTQKIADYFQRTLLPMADLVLDFHSGGRTLDFLPYCASHVLDDKAQEARCRAARDAFAAPFSVEMLEIDNVGMYDTAAEAMGKTFISTELGGGGTATPETVQIARRGLRNILCHAGILDGAPEQHPTRHLTQPGDDCFHFAPHGGMLEMMVALGDPVAEGDTLARIWPIDRTGAAPTTITARMDGLLMARHHPGLCQSGDCLAVLAVETR